MPKMKISKYLRNNIYDLSASPFKLQEKQHKTQLICDNNVFISLYKSVLFAALTTMEINGSP